MNTKKAALRTGSICLKVVLFVLICLGIFYLGQTTYRYTRAVFHEEAMEEKPGRNVKVSLREEMSAKEFAEALEKKGLIEDAGILKLQMKIAGFPETVKAGTYELNTSMTPSEMFEILTEKQEDDS